MTALMALLFSAAERVVSFVLLLMVAMLLVVGLVKELVRDGVTLLGEVRPHRA